MAKFHENVVQVPFASAIALLIDDTTAAAKDRVFEYSAELWCDMLFDHSLVKAALAAKSKLAKYRRKIQQLATSMHYANHTCRFITEGGWQMAHSKLKNKLGSMSTNMASAG